ncbi:MAG: hypothetical protein KDC26_09160 [Armatimonadetes bacterium]|nr:hypothetical protein [Armatimonadota bacterium]
MRSNLKRREAPIASKFWKLASGCFVAIAFVGCGSSEIAQIEGEEKAAPTIENIALSPTDLASPFALYYDDVTIRPGMPLDVALSGSLAKPDTATSLTEIPPKFSKNFKVLGWETPERTVVALGSRDGLVLAMDTREKIKIDEARNEIEAYTVQYGKPLTITSQHSTYAFWTDGNIRLMVLDFEDTVSGNRSMTTALGHTWCMDALRMSPEAAHNDANLAEKLLKDREASGNE